MNFYSLIPEIYGGVAAFVAVLVLMPRFIKLAVCAGFVDQPGGRKRHVSPVPPIGGLVIFSVMIVVSLMTGVDLAVYWPLYAGLGLVVITGALDDYRHISPWVKFAVQFMAATIIVVAGQARLFQLGDLFGFGDLGLGFISIPFSIIAVVLFINAMNLMDGLDGLAGGISFVALFWLMIACAMAGETGMLRDMAPLFGAIWGFLVFNIRSPFRSRAAVFLGDAGSMGLAIVLAWFCIGLAQEPAPVVIAPISIAWIIGLPIIDVCAQFYRRVRAGKHPFSPDRGHFHHHFIGAGFNAAQSTARILLISFVFGGIGYGGVVLGVPEWLLCAVWIVVILAHMTLSARPARYIVILKKLKFGL